jgi:hypothetical protein
VAVNGRIVRLVATRPISVGHGVDAMDQQVVAPVGGQEGVVPDGSRVMGAGCGKGFAQAEETPGRSYPAAPSRWRRRAPPGRPSRT